MSMRDLHVPVDRLTALALAARAYPAPEAADSAADRQALLHVAACPTCAGELSRLTAEADALREAAAAEADAAFDEARLETQRARILDRLAHLGHIARVLRFPQRSGESTMPVSTASRRWVSAAAVAGLVIGLFAGQLVHFLPWDPVNDPERASARVPAPRARALAPVPAPSPVRVLSDDELLDEIEAAVQLRRASSLRALDALTPTAADLWERQPGR